MSVYKEGYKGVEAIKNASKRIYNDAADYGAPTKKGDKLWNLAKQLVADYGVEGKRHLDHYCTVTTQIELLDEWAYSDDERPNRNIKNYTDTFTLTYTKCIMGQCAGYDGFLSITK